jgi:hypothetical protein
VNRIFEEEIGRTGWSRGFRREKTKVHWEHWTRPRMTRLVGLSSDQGIEEQGRGWPRVGSLEMVR